MRLVPHSGTGTKQENKSFPFLSNFLRASSRVAGDFRNVLRRSESFPNFDKTRIMMAETSLGSTTSPLISTSAVAGNPGWNLAPQNLGVAPASSPTIFAMTHPTAEETAALTAMAAEAAAEAAAGAAGDQETMEYVEVLLELPPMPPQALAYTEPEPEDVKPQASHLRLALENYDKQPQWDNYNYPPATNVSKSVAGLNPLFNPSGHNSRTETVVVVGCSTRLVFLIHVFGCQKYHLIFQIAV